MDSCWHDNGIIGGISNSIKENCKFIGVYSDTNLLFFIMFGFVIVIDMALTHVVSRLSECNKRLVQEIGIINNKLAQVKRCNNEEVKYINGKNSDYWRIRIHRNKFD